MNKIISTTALLSLFVGIFAFTTTVSAQYAVQTCNSATLHGWVVTNGYTTNVQFEWGPGGSIIYSTPVQTFADDANYTQLLENLNQGTTYSFRTRVWNENGSHTSDAVTFTTGTCGGETQQQPTVDLTADHTNLSSNNGGTTVRWTSTNATSCTASGGTNGWAGTRQTNAWFSTGILTNTTTYSITCSNSAGSASDSVTINVAGQEQNQPTVDITADNINLSFNGATTVRWTSTNATSCTASGGTNGWSGTRSLSSSFATGNLTNTLTYTISCSNSVGSASDSVTIFVTGQQQQVQQPTVDITADNTNLIAGNSTTVRWTSNNATSCTANNGTGNWPGTRQTNGSFGTSNLNNTITFSITCSNSAGSASDSVTINVNGQQTNAPTVDIRADDTSIDYNDSTVVRWSSSNANSCNANGGTNGWSGNRNRSGSFSTGGLTNTVTYSITCSNNSGSASDSVTINVSGQDNNNQGGLSVDIWADDTSIDYNDSTVVRWSSSNANSCNANGGTNGWSGNRNRSGSFSTGNLTNTVTYSITCSNNNSSRTDSVTINVSGQQQMSVGQPTVFLTADDFNLNLGGSTIVRWTSTNANSCFASGGVGNWLGSRGVSGSFNTGALTRTATYYISCSNNVGSAFDSVTITVPVQTVVFQQAQATYIPPAQISLLTLASAVDVIGCRCQNVAGNSENEILYTLTYQNTSNTTARNLSLQITLPQDTTFVSSAPYSPSISGNTLSYNLSNIAPNSSGAVMVRARTRDNIASGANVTFYSNLGHTGSSGQRLSVNDSVSTQLWSNNYMANNGGGGNIRNMASAATAGIGGALASGGALGWLLLVVLVLLIIILVKHLLTQSKEKKTVITTTTP